MHMVEACPSHLVWLREASGSIASYFTWPVPILGLGFSWNRLDRIRFQLIYALQLQVINTAGKKLKDLKTVQETISKMQLSKVGVGATALWDLG